MKNWLLFLQLTFAASTIQAQDWTGIPVPASPGEGKIWELQEEVSDDFNYDFAPTNSVATIGGKWTNFYHNAWKGPKPTEWRRDHVYVADGFFKIKTSRPNNRTTNVDGQNLAITNLGCATSTQRIQYPVYIETRVKVMNAVLASDVWLLSPDDTQEIDICEAYGSQTRWNNPWFNDERIHLSHHVFIRQPFTDWQPSDEGSFYTDGSTVWSNGFHRIGVYWRDPWHLEYYVDGKLARVRSGKAQIDPKFHTNAVNPGDVNNDTRTGLNKPMDIILNTEDQTWRALQGLTPTAAEIAETDNHTFNIDWVRVYKPKGGEVETVSAVTLDKTEVNTHIGDIFTLQESIVPNNASDLSVVWTTDNPNVATVSAEGVVETLSEGTATITVTTNENNKTATCLVTVSGELVAASLNFDDEDTYLNTSYSVGSELSVTCNFHAGSGNTISEGGAKFWLREIEPGWSVVNDYTVLDTTVIGKEFGQVTATIPLDGVPATAEIPAENWYFLFVTINTSDGQSLDKGIYPINIVKTTSLDEPTNLPQPLKVFPNPAKTVLHIQQPVPSQDFDLQIFDISGKVIAPNIMQSSDTLQLDIQQLPRGTYLVKMVTDKVFTASFVKQ